MQLLIYVALGAGFAMVGAMRTRLRLKTGGPLLFLAGLLLALASCVGGSAGAGGGSESLYTPVREGRAIGPLPEEPVPYYPYQPRELRSLDDVPTEIRAKAETHVRQRVGEDFYRKLRFAGGQFVDQEELRRVNPASRQFRKEVPAYVLKFAFEMPQAGIRRYVASVSLRRNGGVLTEIDLPMLVSDPGKLALKALPQVAGDLARQGLIDPAAATVTATFDRQRDDFLWHFEQVLPGGGPEVRVRTVEVDARTGEVVRRS